MSQIARFEKPYRVLDTAGNCMWQGHALCGTVYEVYTLTSTAYLPGNTAAGAIGSTSAGIAAGIAVVFDTSATTSTVIPRWNYASTDDPGLGVLYGIPVVSGSVAFLGVALTDIAARAATDPPGVGKGYVAGPGSITCVRTTATGIALGKLLVGSATAGMVMSAVTKDATNPAYGTVLGVCVMTNTVAAPGTGSTAMAGVLVSPS